VGAREGDGEIDHEREERGQPGDEEPRVARRGDSDAAH
jgi:hypothetical protein